MYDGHRLDKLYLELPNRMYYSNFHDGLNVYAAALMGHFMHNFCITRLTMKFCVSFWTKVLQKIIFQYVLIHQSDARTGGGIKTYTTSSVLYTTSSVRIVSVNASRSVYGQCKNYILNFVKL